MILFVLFLFCGLCGIGGARIAEEQGGNEVVGFFLGFLLGPLGMILALLIGSREGRQDFKIAQGVMKRCPMCAETIRVEALLCKHCGHKISGN